MKRISVGICLVAGVVFLIVGLLCFVPGWNALKQAQSQKTPTQAQSDTLTNYGNFGSYVQGPVASFWALSGVLFIIATFLLQQEQMANQNEQFKMERFEDSFFHLLETHNHNVASLQDFLTVEKDGGHLSGRDCFNEWRDRFLEHWRGLSEADHNDNGQSVMEKCYLSFAKNFKDLNHYFRHLSALIRFVAENEVKDKSRYMNLIQAQLSVYELFFLHYYGITNLGAPIKPRIEEFGLLKGSQANLLISDSHVGFYPAKAYGYPT